MRLMQLLLPLLFITNLCYGFEDYSDLDLPIIKPEYNANNNRDSNSDNNNNNRDRPDDSLRLNLNPSNRIRERAEPPRLDPNDKPEKPSLVFYGEIIETNVVVYVIDISDSMGWYATSDLKTRLDVAKVEIVKSILSLNENQKFTIVAYNTIIYEMWPATHQASFANKRSAIAWVMSLTHSGGTYTGAAVTFAFRRYSDLDRLILLTDGAPSWDFNINKEVRDGIKRSNYDHDPVDVFALRPETVQGMREFCMGIASDNYGTYYEVR